MKTIKRAHIICIHIQHVTFLLVLFSLATFFISCTNQEEKIQNNIYSKLLNSTTDESTHRWFYFTDSEFLETYSPSLAPERTSLPWTETMRITDGTLINNTAFFTINKLGVLVCPPVSGIQPDGISSQTYLVKNPDLFSECSTGNIYCLNGYPLLNFYTNTIFDPDPTKNTEAVPILVQFNTSTNTFKPLVNSTEFFPAEYSNEFENLKINSLQYEDSKWYASFKSSTKNQTVFLFTESHTNEPELLSTENSAITSTKITEQGFKNATTPINFSKAPDKIQNLLHMIPKSTGFYLKYREDSAASAITYSQNIHKDILLEGYAMSLPHCSFAVFSDGTTYFAGTLPSKHVLKNGNTIAFKLPKLPNNYLYKNAVIAGSNLYVAWEETDFYKTAKSGFLAVNLEKVLYTGDIE